MNIPNLFSAELNSRWYKSLEAKGVATLLITTAIMLMGSVAGLWGLNRVEQVSAPVLKDQIPTVRAIEEMLTQMTIALLSAEQALDQENEVQAGEFALQTNRFIDARQRVETLLAALTWGSDTDAFKNSAGGTHARIWESLGYGKDLSIAPPDQQTAQLAGETGIYFKGFVNNVERALHARQEYILLPTVKKTNEAREESKAYMSKARGFAELTTQYLTTIVNNSNVQAGIRAVQLTTAQTTTRTSVIVISLLAVLTAIFTDLLFIRKVIIEPVRQLARTAESIGKGELSARVDLHTKDEFEYLGQSFNEMAGKLASHALKLEAQVKERTKELAEKVVTIDVQLAHVRRINADLEQSGKMLIRRDLELSRANERLREVDQMKTDFVSVATHQMRTPLSGVRWTLSMIVKGDLGDLTSEQRAFLMKAYESNERMIALIDDLLFTDKIESGKLVITDESTYAPDLLDNVVTELQPIAQKRNITLNFVRPEGKPSPVRMAHQHLRAVFQNLIENAIKYSKDGGTVTIEFVEHDGVLHISVADGGIGIPAEQQDRVFSRFYRAPNAIKMETDGSGLGLYIVKNIVTKHHGKVWFESSENTGSKFHVELPVGASHV